MHTFDLWVAPRQEFSSPDFTLTSLCYSVLGRYRGEIAAESPYEVNCTMEVQSPQSVQINFNNKIITLHNVTIVKNPKIITINASQYPNLLKGSQIKLPTINGASTAAAAGSPVAVNGTVPAPTSAANVKSSPQPVATVKTAQLSNLIPFKNASTLSANAIKSFPKLGVLQLKSPIGGANTLKLQSVPVVKSTQSTVVVSPPKTTTVTNGTGTPMKVQIKPFQANSFVISKPPQKSPSNAATPAKVIISPPQKHKIETSPTAGQPEAKKFCQNLPFCCILCKESYDNSDMLIEHMKNVHPETLKVAGKPESVPVQNGFILTPKSAESKPIQMSNIKFSNLRTIDANGQSRIILKTPQGMNSSQKIIISPNMLDNKIKPIVKTIIPNLAPTVPPLRPVVNETVIQSVAEASPNVQMVKQVNPAPILPVKEIARDVQVVPVEEITTESAPSIVKQVAKDIESVSPPNQLPEKIRKKPGRKPKYPEGMKPGL